MHYKRTKVNYRKIWSDEHGEIPKGYHIHHIDGNCHNNDISNLMACSREEHARLHREMGQPVAAHWIEYGSQASGEDHHFFGQTKYTNEVLAVTADKLSKYVGDNRTQSQKDWDNKKKELVGQNRTANQLKADQRLRDLQRHPWTSCSAVRSLDIWSRLDEIYDWYMETNKKSRACAKHFGMENRRQSFKNALKWIDNNGDPRVNTDWKDFKNG